MNRKQPHVKIIDISGKEENLYHIIEKEKPIAVKFSISEALKVFQPHQTVKYGTIRSNIDVTDSFKTLKNHETNKNI